MMPIKTLLLCFVALLAGCGRSQQIPKEFSGHFVSDREATIARWSETQPWGEKTATIIEKLGPVLGTTEVITDGRNYRVISGDWTEEGEAEFLSIEGTKATVKTYSKVLEREVISTMEADDSGYWVYSDDPLKGYCERFTRKQPTE